MKLNLFEHQTSILFSTLDRFFIFAYLLAYSFKRKISVIFRHSSPGIKFGIGLEFQYDVTR